MIIEHASTKMGGWFNIRNNGAALQRLVNDHGVK